MSSCSTRQLVMLMPCVMVTGQPIIYPRNDLGYAANLMHMMFALPTERYEVQPELARALEIILILHMDHEQNASTSTVRTAGMCCTPRFSLFCSMLLYCSLLHRRYVLHQLLCRGI